MSGNILRFEGLSLEYDWCATCLIVQKSWWLSIQENVDQVNKMSKVPGRHIFYVDLNPDLPCEEAITTGPSTILPGPNSVCATHLLNTNPMKPPGKTLQLGSAGDMRIRHGRNN